jgi:HAMP domain-containing protein
MTYAAIRETEIQEANQAFTKQVTNQVTRITSELNRLEQLLSAGMVDRRVLSEFRYAVDSARKTGWQVEKWLDGDSRELSTVMIEERIQCITRMSNLLALELEVEAKQFAGVSALKDAMRKLDSALAAQA